MIALLSRTLGSQLLLADDFALVEKAWLQSRFELLLSKIGQ